MPIQFHCRSCQGWIEVDDEHAGAKAVCPFCQAVNSVPVRSEPPIAARAGGHAPDAPVPAQSDHRDVGELPADSAAGRQEPTATPRQEFERDQERFGTVPARLPASRPAGGRLTRIGTIGLILAVLSIVMMVTPTVIAFVNLPASLKQQIWHAQPDSTEGLRQLQKEAMQELTAFAQAHPWLGAVSTLGLLLWVLSFVANLAVVFSAGTHRRAYGWAGLAVNTLVLSACICSGIMQRFMGS